MAAMARGGPALGTWSGAAFGDGQDVGGGEDAAGDAVDGRDGGAVAEAVGDGLVELGAGERGVLDGEVAAEEVVDPLVGGDGAVVGVRGAVGFVATSRAAATALGRSSTPSMCRPAMRASAWSGPKPSSVPSSFQRVSKRSPSSSSLPRRVASTASWRLVGIVVAAVVGRARRRSRRIASRTRRTPTAAPRRPRRRGDRAATAARGPGRVLRVGRPGRPRRRRGPCGRGRGARTPTSARRRRAPCSGRARASAAAGRRRGRCGGGTRRRRARRRARCGCGRAQPRRGPWRQGRRGTVRCRCRGARP